MDILERKEADCTNRCLMEESVHDIHQTFPMTKNKSLEERVETLEELSKINSLRSCHEYAMQGLKQPLTYNVDPDGHLMGNPPVEVICNFDQGTTEISHDKEDMVIEIPPCAEPKCYQLDINYNSPMGQIEAIKSISSTCTQDIKFDCDLSI